MFRYYFSTREGKTEGPVTDAQLRDLQVGGLLPPETRICREGTNVWRPITPLYTPQPVTALAAAPIATHPLQQPLAFIGSALLFIGVFCPIVSVPIIGQVNYFHNGKGDGAIIIVLAVASAVIAIMNRFRFLWITGATSFGVLLFTFIRFQFEMAEMKKQVQSGLHDNPFKGLADLAINSIQIQWGVAILILGGVVVIAAAALRPKE